MGYGLAFDMGTTTLAGSLVDLATGECRARRGALNPQHRHGSDVVSRLDFACRSAENLRLLSNLLNAELEGMAAALATEAGEGDPPAVVVFAGNPAMEHMLLGLPVDSLGRIPYRPVFNAGRRTSTKALGWSMQADAYVFPLPGAFVGGDTVAFLFGMGSSVAGTRLFLDLGTNGEIALAAGGALYATSAAAGPAFEGGNLSCGMAALYGAIDSVAFSGDRVDVTTIGGDQPQGICGSAVIEVLAGMIRSGILDPTGRLLSPAEIPSNLGARVLQVGDQPAFVVYRDATRIVALTQNDIRQVQLAKGAVRAGMEVLAQRASISWDSLDEVILTGSFGNHLRPCDLAILGLLTPEMADRTRVIPEGALSGVERAVAGVDGFEAVEGMAAACRVVPLSGNPSFEAEFMRRMNFIP